MAGTEEVLNHHLQCFGKGDLDGIMSDYTEQSVLFTPNGTLKSLAAIRELFTSMFAEFAKPGASFEMSTQQVQGEGAYIVWKAQTADNAYELGTDTFIVRDGKIAIQSFASKITPRG